VRTLLASLVLMLSGGVALSAATDHFRAFTTEAARRLAVREHPVDIPAVTLETETGARLDLAAFRGRWLLVDFVYTRCPTYCTTLGSEFAQLQSSLAVPLARHKVQLLSISFDPEHDTPQRLAEYLQRFRTSDSEWLAARPVGQDGLERLEKRFGITVIPDAFGGYTHNAAIHLVDPHGRLVEIFDVGNPSLAAQAVLQRLAP
jgi:protein SCO1/2